MKTVNNTCKNGATKQVKDIEFWGNGDTFKLISKASSKEEGWLKSTKAMFVGTGCVIQVTTQQGDNVAEALTFVPGVEIYEIIEDDIVISRKLVPMITMQDSIASMGEEAYGKMKSLWDSKNEEEWLK